MSRERILTLLERLYGPDRASATARELDAVLARHRNPARPATEDRWSERDVWLITYPDQFVSPGDPPLRTLRRFYRAQLAPHLDGLHVLPFYPWSSDDGYSVLDHERVDPRYGDWGDVEALAGEGRLMVDAVINHMSTGSPWFRGFLAGDPAYRGFFRTADPGADLSATVRPRTHPLLTRFDTAAGPVHVWTTFSPDQVDLDYRNPAVLVRIVGILLDYARRGAAAIRLDAVGFLWKQEGTPSIHLPQTHVIVRLLRACLDETYPHVLVVTETNVPHQENVSYFGDAEAPEADAVYQFPLPPLVLHTLATGDATALSAWAAGVTGPLGPGRTYLNFLASHDGVGLRPAEGLLTGEDVDRLIELTRSARGEVGYRLLGDGTSAPYELNSTWFDLMAAGWGEDAGIRRHLAAHALMASLPGIAAVYVHSLFGTSNDRAAYERTGEPRKLNRRRFVPLEELERRLRDPTSRASRVLTGMARLLDARASSRAFHPDADLTVLDLGPSLFAVERRHPDAVGRCIVNVGTEPVDVTLGSGWRSLSNGDPLPDRLTLGGWETLWAAPR